MGTGETNAITNYSMVTGELGGGDEGGQNRQGGLDGIGSKGRICCYIT